MSAWDPEIRQALQARSRLQEPMPAQALKLLELVKKKLAVESRVPVDLAG
jgi:hypothetical protein